jgi:hypothetical protein
MSLRRCIPEMLGDGRLNREQADRLGGLYDDLERDFTTKFGKQAAEAMASEEAIKRFEADAINTRRQKDLQIKAQQQIAADVRLFKGDSPAAAATALFTADSRAPYANVERIADMIEGQSHAMMSGLLQRFSRNIVGQVRDRATLRNVVREAFGDSTGDLAAKELAEAWGETAEMLRTRFNAAGGSIGKIDNWGLPQVHNWLSVRSVPYEEWRDFIAPLLDRQKMKDVSGSPMTPQQLELALRNAYETITSEGWNKRQAGQFSGSGKVANRHTDHRFLMFKDGDAWMAYSQKFGRPMSVTAELIDPDGPVFDAMLSHIRGLSREIALMERFGPNPTATVKWVMDGLEQEAKLAKHAGGQRTKENQKAARRVEGLYDEISGRNRETADTTLANVGSAVRSFQVASKLGSAVVSAISDVGFQHVTAKFNGLSSANIVRNYGRMFKFQSSADRQLAARLWMVNETATRMAAAQSRFSGEVVTGELMSRLSEGVMRASGLNAWTQAGRWAFGMEFWSHITSEAPRNWQNIAAPFRRQLERYGFNEAEWDTIRSTPLEETEAGTWLLPDNIVDQNLAERLAMMIATETDYAVPTASLRISSAVNSTLKRGTFIGEIGRSMYQFKSFPMTVMWMHGRRMIENGGYEALKYGARLAITTTFMGAVALQLKSLLQGKDPIEVTGEESDKFWLKAFAQGGGAGVLGDFVGQTTNRFDQKLAEWAAGPTFSSAQDAWNLAKAGYGLATAEPGDKYKAEGRTAKALRRFMQGNTPGSSLWYLKLGFQREVLDQLQAEMDPDYYDSFERMEQRAAEEGTSYWWRPGETSPDRVPEVASAAP